MNVVDTCSSDESVNCEGGEKPKHIDVKSGPCPGNRTGVCSSQRYVKYHTAHYQPVSLIKGKCTLALGKSTNSQHF